MCGLLGEFSFSNELSDLQDFKKLLALSKLRGPDSTKIHSEYHFRLGFNRLALLDLSAAGEQPKVSPSKRYHLVFNGEIYNYKELKEKYDLHQLNSTSDTEVLLVLIDKIGVVDALKELNGMFAIAVIDSENDLLFLARDFAGIKPLFYAKNNNGVVFASQFNQLFKHNWFKDGLELRPEIIKEYFAFGYMQAPNTLFQSIYQVNPGDCLCVNTHGDIETVEILKFEKRQILKKMGFNLDSIKKTIVNSVNLQSHSDRSLASFLSGGIDSSLIVSYAKKYKSDIEAFTLKVIDKNLNESYYAEAYATHLNIKQRVVEAEKEDLINSMEEHFGAFSEPFGDYSSIPTYMVTKKAKLFHTAMLSGDGGDELFWGYPRMYDFLKKAFWFKLPRRSRKKLVRMSNRLGLTNTFAPLFKSLEDFWINKHIKLPQIVLDKCFCSNFSEELVNLYTIESDLNKNELQQFLRWNEFYAHMQRILIKVDRTSMHNSLEVRVPLLDKNVIQEAWASNFSINSLQKLKLPLKKLVWQELPEAIMMRKKKGFSVPIEEWLKTHLKQDLIEKTLDIDLYGKEHFNQNVLKDYVRDFLDEKHNNGWGIWHIYAWQNWAIKFGLFKV